MADYGTDSYGGSEYSTLTSSAVLLYQAGKGLRASSRLLYSNTVLRSSAVLLYKSGKDLKSSAVLLYRASSADYEANVNLGGAEYGTDLTNTIEVFWTGKATKEITAARRVTIQRAVNQSTRWALEIDDEDFTMDPRNPSSGWLDYLKPTPNPDSNGVYQKVVGIKVQLWSVEFVFPPGPILNFSTGGGRPLQPVIGLSGMDMARKLLGRARTLSSQISTFNNLVTNKTVIARVLDDVGIPYNLDRLSKMPIPAWHGQAETPKAMIDRIMESCGGHWAMMGGVFTAWDPKVNTIPNRTYDLAEPSINDIGFDMTEATITNVITAARARTSGDKIGEAAAAGASYGRKSVTFDPSPANGVRWRKAIQIEGLLTDFIFRDASGNVVAVRDIHPSSNVSWPALLLNNGPVSNVASVEFTWGEDPNYPDSTSGTYHIEFFGTPKDRPSWFGSEFDEVFSKVYRYEAGDGGTDDHGPVEAEIFDPLLPNETWLAARADRLFNRARGEARRRALEVPFDPLLDIGDTVRIVNSEISEDVRIYVDQVTHDLNKDRPVTKLSGVPYV